MYTEFERELANINVILHLSENDLSKFRKEVMQIATSCALSITSCLDAIRHAIDNGVATEHLSSMLKDIADEVVERTPMDQILDLTKQERAVFYIDPRFLMQPRDAKRFLKDIADVVVEIVVERTPMHLILSLIQDEQAAKYSERAHTMSLYRIDAEHIVRGFRVLGKASRHQFKRAKQGEDCKNYLTVQGERGETMSTRTETHYCIEVYSGQGKGWYPISDLHAWNTEEVKRMITHHGMIGDNIQGSLRVVCQTTTIITEVVIPCEPDSFRLEERRNDNQ